MKSLLLALIGFVAACHSDDDLRYPDECDKWVVTCVYNAGYGRNTFVADSVESYDGKFAVIFVDGKRTELGCDEILLRRKKCL